MTPEEVLVEVIGIIKERAGTHGDAFEQNEDVARRWSQHLLDRHGIVVELGADDVCEMMVELKKSRMAHGEADNPEHTLDRIGYLAIAAAARKP
jgi:hypothetical protein